MAQISNLPTTYISTGILAVPHLAVGGGIDPNTLCCEELQEKADWLNLGYYSDKPGIQLVLSVSCEDCFLELFLKFCPFCGEELKVV